MAASLTLADVEFAMVVEAGPLESQAIRLARSIRRHVDGCAVTAVSPRRSRRPSKSTVRELEGQDAEYLDLDLSSACPEYGPSFKVLAMAEIERRPARRPVLAQIDSDTAFVAHASLDLASGAADLYARPVDGKGMSTTGPADPFDLWWHRACELCKVDYNGLGRVRTTIDKVDVLARYNGGLAIAWRGTELYGRTADFFNRIVATGLRPWPEPRYGISASTGLVESETARWWGTTEAALALAAAGLRVEILPESWNVPIWLHEPAVQPVHVHYHQWMKRRPEAELAAPASWRWQWQTP
jgi:hypothetical protein